MSHLCPECGLEHGADIDAAPVVETEAVTEAAVEIAKVEADRDITLAKIAVKAEETGDTARIAELEGRLRGIEEMLDRLAPPAPAEEIPAEPEVVVVDAPEPDPVIDAGGIEPPPIAEPVAGKGKRRSAWW